MIEAAAERCRAEEELFDNARRGTCRRASSSSWKMEEMMEMGGSKRWLAAPRDFRQWDEDPGTRNYRPWWKKYK